MMFVENFFNNVKNIINKYPEIFHNIKLYRDHKKLKRIEYKLKINLTIDPAVYEKYREYCYKRGFKVSSRIESLMKEELDRIIDKKS